MKVNSNIVISVLTAALIGLTGCSSDSTDAAAAYVAATPTAPDSYEGATGDNNLSTAGSITVGGALQSRSAFPAGDEDWIGVELEEGTIYELFTTNLNETGDTFLYLLDENGSALTQDDDHIDYDSDIEEYNATYSGTHYLRVRSYSASEATSYQLGVRVHVDADNDGYTPSFDCNDNNDTIFASATEIPGDGIDQDCSGVDALDSNVTDSYENDDTAANAKPMAVTAGSYDEIQHRNDVHSKMRTLDTTSDVDFYTITIPAKSAARYMEYHGNTSYIWNLYEANGTLITSGTSQMSNFLENTTDTSKTYHVEFASNGVDTGWYAPALVPVGTDNDADGYYTGDWSADCNDNDPLIFPGGDDSNTTDGIDSDCDGIDG